MGEEEEEERHDGMWVAPHERRFEFAVEMNQKMDGAVQVTRLSITSLRNFNNG